MIVPNRVYILVTGIVTCGISFGLNYLVAFLLYPVGGEPKPSLWPMPKTIAGDVFVTCWLEVFMIWFIGTGLAMRDVRTEKIIRKWRAEDVTVPGILRRWPGLFAAPDAFGTPCNCKALTKSLLVSARLGALSLVTVGTIVVLILWIIEAQVNAWTPQQLWEFKGLLGMILALGPACLAAYCALTNVSSFETEPFSDTDTLHPPA